MTSSSCRRNSQPRGPSVSGTKLRIRYPMTLLTYSHEYGVGPHSSPPPPVISRRKSSTIVPSPVYSSLIGPCDDSYTLSVRPVSTTICVSVHPFGSCHTGSVGLVEPLYDSHLKYRLLRPLPTVPGLTRPRTSRTIPLTGNKNSVIPRYPPKPRPLTVLV